MRKFHHRLVIATAAILMAASINAQAQRTMKEQSVIGAKTSFNGMSAGASIDYSQYTLNGFWYVGVSGNDYYALYTSNDWLRYDHICGYGGYLFRLVGTRSRSINLYGGGEVIVGLELIDPFEEKMNLRVLAVHFDLRSFLWCPSGLPKRSILKIVRSKLNIGMVLFVMKRAKLRIKEVFP